MQATQHTHRFLFTPAFVLLASVSVAAAQGDLSAPSIPGPARVQMTPQSRSLAFQGAHSGRNISVVSAPDVARLLAEDELAGPGPLRMGVVQELAPVTPVGGPWVQLADGQWLWTWMVRASGAHGLRLRVRGFGPDAEGVLTLYDASGTEARGPVDRAEAADREGLWTPTIHSDHVVLEYLLPAGSDPEALADPPRFDGVLYVYRDPNPGGPQASGGPVTCHLDWACEPAWSSEGRGVVALGWITGGTGFFCSGAILNRIPQDFDPLVMTATHCGVTNQNVGSLEVTWFWQRSSCGGTLPNLADLPTTRGFQVLVRDVTTDWTLIGLRDGVPGGTYFLGWDTGTVSDDRPVAGIHHPQGSWKRMSFGEKQDNGGTRPDPGGGLTCVQGNSHAVRFLTGDGLVEGGSSGSPLFDATSQRVIGTLSCGSAPDCGSSNTASYGRLDQADTLLLPYLDPADPVYADAGHGGSEQGTNSQPFDTLAEASFAVIEGSQIRMVAGTYSESLTIDRPMRIAAVGGHVVIQ